MINVREVTFNLYGQKHKVILSRDIIQRGIGILFIVLSAGLLGVFELFKWGWDLSMLKNYEFWSGYFIKLAMLYLAFFGAYIFQRSRNLNNPKVVIQKQTLKQNKKLISSHFQTSHCERWIENVLNYEDKLSIYQEFLEHKNSSLNLVEPHEPIIGCKLYKLKLFIFQIRKKKYDQGEKLRNYYEQQLDIINKHKQVIELYKSDKIEEAKALYKTFEREDDFKYFMPNYKGLNFPKLFNVSMESQHQKSNIVDYKETSVVVMKVIKTISFGCILLAFIGSIVPEIIKDINYMTIIFIVFNMLLMLWYILNGVLTANKFVFGNVMSADAERIRICNKYRDDCIKNHIDWVKDLKSEIDYVDEKNEKSGE